MSFVGMVHASGHLPPPQADDVRGLRAEARRAGGTDAARRDALGLRRDARHGLHRSAGTEGMIILQFKDLQQLRLYLALMLMNIMICSLQMENCH